MKTNYGFGSTFKKSTGSSSIFQSPSSFYARVVDVILDESHKLYKNYGSSQSINGIFYRELTKVQDEEELKDLPFAYQGSANIRKVPLKGEIVKIEYRSSENRSNLADSVKPYWVEIIPIWNHPHHNDYPDILQFPERADNPDFGKFFEESKKVNPLQLFPGDIAIESRYGQSIRFSGTKYSSNPWIDNSNNNKPILIIRNGQKEEGTQEVGLDSIKSVIEDVNKDSSSIYLTSDHKVEITEANSKQNSWKTKPTKQKEFKGSQIILNSDRIVVNAKNGDSLFSSTGGVGINGKTLSLDGEDYIGLDATKIYLGVAALKQEHEPVLLGETTVKWLEDYLGQFEQLLNTMSKLPPAPPAAIALLITISNTLLPVIKILKQRLPLLESRKVFTE